MTDAYSHLDMDHESPLEDIDARRRGAGLTKVLLVETWNGANRKLLESALLKQRMTSFLVALCHRGGSAGHLTSFLQISSLAGVRIPAAHIHADDAACRGVHETGKLLLAHAENGIGPLALNLERLIQALPGIRIYVPHLGWPAHQGKEDPEWRSAFRNLAPCSSIIFGISAISTFSALPFPHEDVAELARWAIPQLPPERIVIGSDYPMMEKSRYEHYLSLARDWVVGVYPGWTCPFEELTA
jgi:predicted TIM-barrel fold metal-dependent hydrolase